MIREPGRILWIFLVIFCSCGVSLNSSAKKDEVINYQREMNFHTIRVYIDARIISESGYEFHEKSKIWNPIIPIMKKSLKRLYGENVDIVITNITEKEAKVEKDEIEIDIKIKLIKPSGFIMPCISGITLGIIPFSQKNRIQMQTVISNNINKKTKKYILEDEYKFWVSSIFIIVYPFVQTDLDLLYQVLDDQNKTVFKNATYDQLFK